MQPIDGSDNVALMSGTWNYPTQIHFAPGNMSTLPELCTELAMEAPLLVCDQGLVNLPFVIALQTSVAQAGITLGVFSDVKPNPTGSNVSDGVDAYRRGHHDGVIALGGGSALDAGKAIALMVGQDRPLWDFEDAGDNWRRVNETGMAPVIAIPTTSGTGSEVGRASVIVDESRHKKVIIFHPKMLPARVLCDPDVTCGLPPHITAATGLDAFVHCFEAYCAPGFHPMADGIALQGMELIKDNLLTAFTHGEDRVARANMMVASSMGATAFQKGLGGVHALAHPLGAIYDKHHGLLNAILLPYVVTRNFSVIETKLEKLARYLSLEDTTATGFVDWINAFRHALDIPNGLLEIGISGERCDEIGVLASLDAAAGGNPVPLSAQDYTDIFLSAL